MWGKKKPGAGPERQTPHVFSHKCILASNVHNYMYIQFGVPVEVRKVEWVQNLKEWERPSRRRGY